MDAQEWELLEIHDDNVGIKNPTTSTTTVPTSLMSYFLRPQSLKTKVHPVPLETSGPKLQQHEDPPTPSLGIESGGLRASADEDEVVSNAFFTKMKETEFVDDMEMATKRSKGLESSGADKFNIWKWSLIGVAAAAGFCIIGSWNNTNSKQNQKHHHQR
ncbi:hypothetical protein C2S53_016022 [Perilla frutescens var. hirtella]|uniref:Transmembrane protein n=1 Tax=Perilla frutescens var. hirtella TaxID=608512 RepID=A0AAD4J5H1_PERFH|nr:hypothetical protein C2S51_026334 [Perilla frutescens var. frutescens]KAH6827581.1 hypothetical protein C2S53_016022 [Perilla frutescens var. hirtella]